MRTTITCALVLALILLMSPSAKRQSSDTLEQRVEQLEKTVLKDSYHPERTVVVRLANVEKTMESLVKDRDDAKSEARDRDSSSRSLVELAKQSDLLQRRLKAMEEQLSRNNPRDLDREVDQLKHDLDRLAARLRQLEAK